MCEIDFSDGEPIKFWRQTPRVARKEHRCTVCRGPILPGAKYVIHSSATVDGVFDEKCCSTCEADRIAFGDAHRVSMLPGSLVDELINCLDYDEEESRAWRPMLDRIKASRKAHEAAP